ncbi:uncharacterized protein EDB93DRAFT_1241866 [Suillus bovinus]|uniref:uncharacterized protein n=1 Tax=Suillus bovinus TaxID=48563 RepID=UPI001B8757C5|nr:uncharacterized protein EDB93DRAFT_1241866 [Suillus bovinus]KAG2140522.1 hypothetical protein EDB93DRAFT_1241866 [Suillus bovinus]
MSPYPKLAALDTECGPNAHKPAEDNIELKSSSHFSRNHNERWGMYGDVPKIIYNILKHNTKLAIICNRALWWWNVMDPKDNKKKSIIHMVKFNEVYDGWTPYKYTDMILFNEEATNNLVRVEQGIVFQVSRDQKGLTWGNYQQGLDQWRCLHTIRSPYIGQNLKSYSDPMFIGFTGMDEGMVNLLMQGKNRVDLKEAAHWGYAMYITDDARIVRYFANWIKSNAFGATARTHIWAPEDSSIMTNIQGDNKFKIAWDQENRDAKVAEWGVKMPYILFSHHFHMGGMPIAPTRWNEMVVYTPVQDALMLTIPLTDQQVDEKIALGGQFVKFEEQISNWNIKVPDVTWADFKKYGENFCH